jgi:hypothetical protein
MLSLIFFNSQATSLLIANSWLLFAALGYGGAVKKSRQESNDSILAHWLYVVTSIIRFNVICFHVYDSSYWGDDGNVNFRKTLFAVLYTEIAYGVIYLK